MQIPTYDSAPIAPNVLPTPQRSGNSPVAQALGGLGNAASSVGSEALSYAADQQYKADVTRHDVATSQLLDLEETLKHGTNGKGGYDNEKGIYDADAYLQQYTTGADAIRKSLTPRQAQMFDHTTMRYESTFKNSLYTHNAEQGHLAAVGSAEAVTSKLQSKAMAEYDKMDAGGDFWKTLTDIGAKALYRSELAHGINKDVNDADVAEATSKAIYDAIDQLSIKNPLKAEETLKSAVVAGHIQNPALLLKMEKELEPKLEAYRTDELVDKVSRHFPKDRSEPFDRYQYNKEVDAETATPSIRKAAKEQIKQHESDWNDSAKQQFVILKGKVLIRAQNDWSAKPPRTTSVEAVKQSSEYGKLDDGERTDLLKQVEAENWKITSHNETIRTSLRVAESAERARAKEADTAKHKLVVEEQNKEASYWLTHSDEVERLTPDQINALPVSHADMKQITAEKAKLTTPKALHHAKIADTTLRNIFTAAGITDADTQQKMASYAKRMLAADQEDEKRFFSPDETEAKIIKGLQIVYKDEVSNNLFGGTTKTRVAKRRMEVAAKDVIYPDDVKTKVDEYFRTLSPAKRKIAEKYKNKYYEQALQDKALGAK